MQVDRKQVLAKNISHPMITFTNTACLFCMFEVMTILKRAYTYCLIETPA